MFGAKLNLNELFRIQKKSKKHLIKKDRLET